MGESGAPRGENPPRQGHAHPWKTSCQLEEPNSTHAIHLFGLHPPFSTSWVPEEKILSRRNITEKG